MPIAPTVSASSGAVVPKRASCFIAACGSAQISTNRGGPPDSDRAQGGGGAERPARGLFVGEHRTIPETKSPDSDTRGPLLTRSLRDFGWRLRRLCC